MPQGSAAGWKLTVPVSGPAPETVTTLAPSGVGAAAEVLARAFRDNPINCAVVDGGKERRLRANRAGLRSALHACLGRSVILTALDPESGAEKTHSNSTHREPLGVLVALPPASFPLPSPSLIDQLRTWLAQGRRAAERWGEVHSALEAVHPISPHWYLSLLGVDPDRQGLGIGSALLDVWLTSVDGEAAASYLETDREENLGLYRRVGFAVQQRIEVLGTPVWCMWRPPFRKQPADAGSEMRAETREPR